MPLILNVGLSKKVGLPHYGSLGVSCNIQVELDSALLQCDLDGFHEKLKRAYAACHQAVNEELHRQQSSALAESGSAAPAKGLHCSATGNGRPSGQPGVRRATASQVRAIQAIAQRIDLDLGPWLHSRFGQAAAAELSLAEASSAIDQLQDLAAHHSGDPA